MVGKNSGRIKYGTFYQHAPLRICWHEQNPLCYTPWGGGGGPDTLTLIIYLARKVPQVRIEPGRLRSELIVKPTVLHIASKVYEGSK